MLFGTISVFRLTIVEYFQTPEPEDLRLNPIFKYRKYLALSLLATEMGSGSVDLFKEFVISNENWGASRVVAIHRWSRTVQREGVHEWLGKTDSRSEHRCFIFVATIMAVVVFCRSIYIYTYSIATSSSSSSSSK